MPKMENTFKWSANGKSGGSVDLSNYYTKVEINKLINTNKTEIDSTKAIVDDILVRQTEQNDMINANARDINNCYTKMQVDTKILDISHFSNEDAIVFYDNNLSLLIFEVPTANINHDDFIGNMPGLISSFRKIKNIESATYNVKNQDGDVLTKSLDLLISHYNGRIFIKNYQKTFDSDVKYIRFIIWVKLKE